MKRVYAILEDALVPDTELLISILEYAGARRGGVYIADVYHLVRVKNDITIAFGAKVYIAKVQKLGQGRLPACIAFGLTFNPSQGRMNVYNSIIDCSNPHEVRFGIDRESTIDRLF